MVEQEFIKRIGNNINKRRKEKGFSLLDLSSRCNIEKTNLIPIEKGRRNPTCLTLFKISQALEIEMWELFV